MFSKTFTLEEANEALNKVRPIFTEVSELNEKRKFLSEDMKIIMSIWGDDVFKESNPDKKLYEEKSEQLDKHSNEMKTRIQKIADLGAIVKSIDRGMIDFPFDNDGELVYLCWKNGEDEITHWHAINEGPARRRPIKEMGAVTFTP